MSKFIDIMVVIDTEYVIENSGIKGTVANPTGIGHNQLFMITQPSDLVSGQATGDLAIRAVTGDTIRWYSTSLSGNTDQSAIIYSAPYWTGDYVTSNPVMEVITSKRPIPDSKTPTSFTTEIEKIFFMQCTVENPGTQKYYVYFYIVDKNPKSGELTPVSYYFWDPSITAIV